MSTQETLFETEAIPHLDALYRTALRLTYDRSKAEDAVQEVYLQAWKSFHRYEPGTNCRAWLYKILFHVVNHQRRSWYRHAAHVVEAEPEQLEATAIYTPPIPATLTDEEVLAALANVPELYRQVVLLVDVEEFSYKEAAEALAVPIGTVMSRLSRGREALRRHLGGMARSYGVAAAAEVAIRA
jgi:RNA polymerase sigma-70 factor (ECF subfamily)